MIEAEAEFSEAVKGHDVRHATEVVDRYGPATEAKGEER